MDHCNYEFDIPGEIWLFTKEILPGLESYYDQFNRIKVPFNIFKPYIDKIFLMEKLNDDLVENVKCNKKFRL